MEIARYFGDFQARLLLTLFYFTVFVPFGAGLRLLGDPWRLRRSPEASGWEACEGENAVVFYEKPLPKFERILLSCLGTGRLQVMRRDWNPLCYELVQRFGQAPRGRCC